MAGLHVCGSDRVSTLWSFSYHVAWRPAASSHLFAWVMLFTRDADKLHHELRDKGALIRMPPTDMPWGLGEMHVSDLDGNVLRFGRSIDDD